MIRKLIILEVLEQQLRKLQNFLASLDVLSSVCCLLKLQGLY